MAEPIPDSYVFVLYFLVIVLFLAHLRCACPALCGVAHLYFQFFTQRPTPVSSLLSIPQSASRNNRDRLSSKGVLRTERGRVLIPNLYSHYLSILPAILSTLLIPMALLLSLIHSVCSGTSLYFSQLCIRISILLLLWLYC